jgi:hypothetical protein
MLNYATVTTTSPMWNGPSCPTCGARYLGSHTCSHDDIVRRVNELLAMLATLSPRRAADHADRMSGCPCRPENGGSGICGCVLGGPQVTC